MTMYLINVKQSPNKCFCHQIQGQVGMVVSGKNLSTRYPGAHAVFGL